MSDVLKDQIPELDQDVSEFADKIISVVIELRAGAEQEAMIGTLVSVSSGEDPVLEVKVELADAFAFIGTEKPCKETSTFTVLNVQLHLGLETIVLKGPFHIVSAKLHGVDVTTQMCILTLCLSL